MTPEELAELDAQLVAAARAFFTGIGCLLALATLTWIFS